jgi:membrane-associated protein
MEMLMQFVQFFLHLDHHLVALVQHYGNWAYLILFLIVFCETGLVVTPFLPGDSLLFAAGALAATAMFHPGILFVLFLVAAVSGNTVNYFIGYWFGEKLIEGKRQLIRRDYLERTRKFYEKHGGKAVVLSRFIPILRTFAPFMAGIAEMHYLKYLTYNLVGALAWVSLFVWGGYFFGNLPGIKHNFTLVILGIIVVSFVPVVVEFWKARKNKK